jgi:Metallo-peptidase family M12/IPT/TIG domain
MAAMALRTRQLLPLAVMALAPMVAAAADLKAAAPGRLIDAPDGQSRMEQIMVEPTLAPSLLGVPLEGRVRVEDWPVAPGVRRAVVVARHDVYAPDAKIVVIERGKEVEIPRSKLVFLWGTAEGDGATLVLITVDPDTALISGSSMTTAGSFDLLAPSAERPFHLLARDGALREADATGQGFQCGFGDLPKDPARDALRAARLGTSLPQALSRLHSATIAVDTDNELMGIKFADNPTNATNYIAQVFAGITAIYERDLFVRLLQGFTVLRPSTTPDPYIQSSGGNADGAKLNEVSTYWNNNYSGIQRALVMMLSGKQTGGGWSGIAWIGGLCEPFFGVGFNQVPRAGITANSSDFQLIGHEMGHNFGSPHTHCTDTSANAGIQPIDFCWSAECGSNWVPASGQVCPANFTINPANGAPVTGVRGTLMSYCHLLGGCGVTNVFHPQSISIAISPDVDAAVNQCLFPVNTPPTVTNINPNGGTTAGGTAVTILGTNFVTPATVTLGGAAATAVTVTSPATITATTPAHVAGIVDVVVQTNALTTTLGGGYFYFTPAPAAKFYTLSPCRLVDTRTTNAPALPPSGRRDFTLAGACGIPTTATAISVNLTVTGPTGGGYVSLFPGNGVAPATSSINFSANQTRANNAVVFLATNGTGVLAVFNGAAGTANVILDVNGYFQ